MAAVPKFEPSGCTTSPGRLLGSWNGSREEEPVNTRNHINITILGCEWAERPKRRRTEGGLQCTLYTPICEYELVSMADGVGFEMRQSQVAIRLTRVVAGRQLGRTSCNQVATRITWKPMMRIRTANSYDVDGL
jgi:hypothetical protein